MNPIPIHLQSLITGLVSNDRQGSDSSGPPSSASSRDLFSRATFASPGRGKSTPPALPEVRCAKALGKELYVGCSDGSLIRCSLRDDGPSTGDAYSVTSRQIIPTKRSIDQIELVPSVYKALILAGGTIHFYTLPGLDPIPSNVIQPIRSVFTFAMDEGDTRKDQYPAPRPPSAPSSQGVAPWAAIGSSPRTKTTESVELCVFRERLVSVYRLSERLYPLRELSFPEGINTPMILAKRVGNTLCMASTTMYSIAPIDKFTDDLHEFVFVRQMEDRHQLPPLKPLITVVNGDEFLVCTESTAEITFGLILDPEGGMGAPPLEWSTYPVAISSDGQYVSVLWQDRSIQIYETEKQLPSTLSQTIPAHTYSPTTSTPSYPFSFSLNSGTFLIPSSLRSRLLHPVSVNLSPQRVQSPTHQLSPQAAHSSLRLQSTRDKPHTLQQLIYSRTLMVGTDAIHAFAPSTFLSRAEDLIEASRVADVDELCRNAVASYGGRVEGSDLETDMNYIYQRLAFKCLAETLFDDAGEHFYRARSDPRLLIRLYPDLCGALISPSDTIEIFAGLEEIVQSATPVDDLIRNYSPHIEPDVATAPSTAELISLLGHSARVMLLQYLRRIRDGRSLGKTEVNALDRVIDTVFVKLLAENDQREDLREVLEKHLGSVDINEVEPVLARYEHYWALAVIYRRAKRDEELLNLWAKVAEGVWVDPLIDTPVRDLTTFLSTSRNATLIQKYGEWLTRHDPASAFSLFTTLPDRKRGAAIKIKEADVLRAFKEADPLFAEQYLEYLVLNRRSQDPQLHEELSQKYLDSLLSLLKKPDIQAGFIQSMADYAALQTKEPFIIHFASQSLDSEVKTTRVKALLFLQGSVYYDVRAARERVEPHRDLLILERAILDGKMGNDRSALSLLSQMADYTSAEAYCILGGDVISNTIAQAVGMRLALTEWASLIGNTNTSDKRKRDLLRILMEVYMRGRETPSLETANLLNSQAMNLNVADVLSNVPDTWSLSAISSFLTRSLRRTQHEAHEVEIVKGISRGQHLETLDYTYTIIRAEGGVVEEPVEGNGEDDIEGDEEKSSGFVEKIDVVPEEAGMPSSITSIDLRGRKEGFAEDMQEL